MKVSFLLAMARQVEGDNMLIDIKYAHTDEEKVWTWWRKNQSNQNLLPTAARLGDMDCVITYGVHSNIEVETD